MSFQKPSCFSHSSGFKKNLLLSSSSVHAVQPLKTKSHSFLGSPVKRAFCLSPTNLPKKIGVVGAGQMGTGIAKVAAHQGGCQVMIMDNSETQLQKSIKFIDNLLQKDLSKGKVAEDQVQPIKSRISTTSSLKELASCEFIVEAATENPSLKLSIFNQLDEAMPANAILASNTSSISIGAIGGGTKRPERVIGMHFMNPVPVMKLVEIIPSLATDKNTFETTVALAQAFGKTTTVSQDYPGFIANRLLCPYLNEAFYALQENIGTPEDIDTTMKLGTNVPMGPLTLADFIGLDTVLAIMRVLHDRLGDSKYRPCPLLVRYVEAGWLGKKTGRGVFKY